MEAPLEDALEQEQDAEEPASAASTDIEAPEADAVEQHQPVDRGRYAVERPTLDEVDEADAAEQAHVVEGDDDEYR